MGKAVPHYSAVDDEALKAYILAGVFICADKPDAMLEALKPGWNNKIDLPVEEKTSFLKEQGVAVDINAVFPWPSLLSEGIDHLQFCASFFKQPDLFIRIRPGYTSAVIKKLTDAGVRFSVKSDNALALPNLTKIDDHIIIDEEAVVQDYSSQRVAELLQPVKETIKPVIKVWDCCAASGGKAILAKDYLGNIDLTVSDIRQSILANLQSRFKRAAMPHYKLFEADLSKPGVPADKSGYDLIICDAPCSGSGTWGRTPEQLYFWEERKLEHYTSLQKKIVNNIIPFVKPGGYLLYITCSVFKEENEERVKEILSKTDLRLVQMQNIKGYDKKADTMFGALLRTG